MLSCNSAASAGWLIVPRSNHAARAVLWGFAPRCAPRCGRAFLIQDCTLSLRDLSLQVAIARLPACRHSFTFACSGALPAPFAAQVAISPVRVQKRRLRVSTKEHQQLTRVRPGQLAGLGWHPTVSSCQSLQALAARTAEPVAEPCTGCQVGLESSGIHNGADLRISTGGPRPFRSRRFARVWPGITGCRRRCGHCCS